MIVIPNEVRDLQFCRALRNCRSLSLLGMTNQKNPRELGVLSG
jgi:hypothetical protein